MRCIMPIFLGSRRPFHFCPFYFVFNLFFLVVFYLGILKVSEHAPRHGDFGFDGP
jgi:hypothetical protein